jgi:hypothetical protein
MCELVPPTSRWETWKEVYRKDEFSGVAHIERSADKWARDPTGSEWHEKWWERYNATGYVERGVEKSGRHGQQAWWEKWGEQHDGSGGDSLKWTVGLALFAHVILQSKHQLTTAGMLPCNQSDTHPGAGVTTHR